MTDHCEIAVVGMAATFPGSHGLEGFWTTVLENRVALRDVPADRISEAFYSETTPASLRLRGRRGGFLEPSPGIDPARHGIMPARAASMEPEQLMVLELAREAFADAGLSESIAFRHRRGGVVLGRSNISGPGRLRLEQTLRGGLDLQEILGRYATSISSREIDDIVERYRAHYRTQVSRGDAETLIPNLVASRIARRYNFDGPAYTVDAACASSLIAIEQSCEALATHRADVMLCGGVHLWQDESLWWAFESLGAISRSGVPRPFDKDADGLALGEGAALFVLKRAEDARRDGDAPYGLIVGWGSSSDGSQGAALAPSRDGQLRALDMAWRASGRDPAEVGYLEAHATGTPVGDETELSTLRRFFGDPPPGSSRPGIGAVKGLIGHTLAAAGAASLAKILLALSRAVRPPIGNLSHARDELLETRFHPYVAPSPWNDEQRLAAVSAFGFGGVNAHLVVRSAGERAPSSRCETQRPRRFAAEDAASLAARLRATETGGNSGCRAVLLDDKKRELAAAAAGSGRSVRRSRAGFSVSFDRLIAEGGKIAFLFPGLDAVRSTAAPGPESRSASPERQGVAIVAEGIEICNALGDAGVTPDVVAGHSIGEWAAMVAAGVVERPVAERIMKEVNGEYFDFPSVEYLVAACDVATAEGVASSCPGVEVSHDNCPTQTVLCAPAEALARATQKLKEARVPCWKLPFATGFHTSYMATGIVRHRETVGNLAFASPRVPIWSATTAAEFPTAPDEVRHLLIEQVLKRVRFRELVERLYREGDVRVFLQIGVGGLPSFVEDTLRGAAFLSVSTSDGGKSLAQQIEWVKALLWAEGRSDRTTAKHVRLGLGVPTFADVLRTSSEALPGESEPARTNVSAGAWEVSLAAFPELADHSFVKQPAGWSEPSDTDPVMPLSGILDMLVSSFERSSEGRRAAEVRNLVARRWMRAVPALVLDASIRRLPDADEYCVELGDFAQAHIVPAGSRPSADEPVWRAPSHARPAPMTAREVYDNRWLFHGPRYQTMVAIDRVWTDGIAGRVRYDRTQGAALDGAAQFVGTWVMLNADVNKLTIPVGVRAVKLGAARPVTGDVVDCVARIVRVTDLMVTADFQLSVGGKVWLTVYGWQDLRLELDERIWNFMRWPERYSASRRLETGIVLEDRAYQVRGIDEYVFRQFFGAREREQLTSGGSVNWDEASRRIAAKDAARELLWSRGAREIFPVEVSCAPSGNGDRFELHCRGERLRATLVDTGGQWVAVCGSPHWPDARFAPGDCTKVREKDGALAIGNGTLEWRRNEEHMRSESNA